MAVPNVGVFGPYGRTERPAEAAAQAVRGAWLSGRTDRDFYSNKDVLLGFLSNPEVTEDDVINLFKNSPLSLNPDGGFLKEIREALCRFPGFLGRYQTAWYAQRPGVSGLVGSMYRPEPQPSATPLRSLAPAAAAGPIMPPLSGLKRELSEKEKRTLQTIARAPDKHVPFLTGTAVPHDIEVLFGAVTAAAFVSEKGSLACDTEKQIKDAGGIFLTQNYFDLRNPGEKKRYFVGIVAMPDPESGGGYILHLAPWYSSFSSEEVENLMKEAAAAATEKGIRITSCETQIGRFSEPTWTAFQEWKKKNR